MSNHKFNRTVIKRITAHDFAQPASQGNLSALLIMTAIAVAVLCLTLKAMGAGQ